MTNHSETERLMPQALHWGSVSQERLSQASTMFTTAGRRIYVIGDIDGRFRRRSNPYDLYAFGQPHPKDPLGYKLQGVWAQPVKGVNRYGYTIDQDGERWTLEDAERFTQSFASVQFDYRKGPVEAVRSDFTAQDLPVLFSTLTLRNQGEDLLDLRLAFQVEFDLEDAWFTKMARQRNFDEQVSIQNGCLVARSKVLPKVWAAAAGGERPADEVHLLDGSFGELVYQVHLAPGAVESFTFGISIAVENGVPQALDLLANELPEHGLLLQEKQSLFADLFSSGPHFSSPDPAMNTAFDLARANLQMLEAESPSLGRYFYAGLEMFPFWFSNDGAYSVVGMAASRFTDTALNHIAIGLDHLDQGRVPHQISPSGRVAFAGNAQETPLWVMSIWDAYRWTGSQGFLKDMFPGAVKGMYEYVLGTIDPDGDGYPSGPGMVEVEGMGEEKLDSAAYTWAAFQSLALMADALGDIEQAARAREQMARIGAKFDSDWWDPGSGSYAMSLVDPGNGRYAVPHWAVVVPLEVGLAAPDLAAQTFATIRAHYLNQWGIKHTVGEDERVWTLPTATLSRAAYRYGEDELGFSMLHHLTDTLNTGSIGLFHELIPEGASIIQLWSGAIFIRGVIEDLMGIEVNAAEHCLRAAPRLPKDWNAAVLQDLVFGEHTIRVEAAGNSVTVFHQNGPQDLLVEYVSPTGERSECVVKVGESNKASWA